MDGFYDNFEIENYNRTSVDDHVIDGTSILIVGIVSLILIILIIMGIRIFSKKLEELGCEGIQEIRRVEDIEPLPQYQEREIPTEAEINLSNYIQSNNTISTIPRDTMNIINRLNEASAQQMTQQSTHHENTENQEEEEEDSYSSMPSTSIIPVPFPQKENMPHIPPPCYDIALTQPRITTKGMIVLPQDPSFSLLPFLSRSPSTNNQNIRRNRKRLRRFFIIHRRHSNRFPNTNSPNNYRFQDSQNNSILSTTSHSSSTSSLHLMTNFESNPNLNHHNHFRRHLRESSRHSSRLNVFRRHHHSNSIRRQRRRRHHCADNASISIYYPTSVADIPEDHYSIEVHDCNNNNVRNYQPSSNTSSFERNSTTVEDTSNCQDPEVSLNTVQHLLSNENTTSGVKQSQDYQTIPLKEQCDELCLDITQAVSSNYH
ncbi:hypothetical protein BCR36DRAFT_584879 [Piromyces finnis]|uniref:Uncharacterized protein n=1 Tax=Piromyces finnis TaxID=1754191 RepID=A0A1Y1V4X1_9FUNG|nr:hypothetical protein BCR36DRAFT_584879 [Piromyces finnis]|eukprot:ORX47376.1 hypothetical protein BCR36DRAFT_584879 [Piromyces finnis]